MKKSVKIIGLILSAVMVTACFSACDGTSTAEDAQTASTNQSLTEMNKQIGMPSITNFTEKKELKHIYELRDDSKLICYYYYYNEYTGKLSYQGRCLGYGIPYSTEYTSPQKSTYDYHTTVVVPQADPNGLYAPASADATWVIAIDDNGKQHIEEAEPHLVVSDTKKPKRLCDPSTLPSDY